MNTVLTKENAAQIKAARQDKLSLSDLDDFVEEVVEQPEVMSEGERQSRITESVVNAPKGQTMEPLTLQYIDAGVFSLTRAPSPNLKNENFKNDLLYWSTLAKQALKLAPNPSAALIAMVQHVGSTEGVLQAVRIIRSVMGQVLWQASVDIAKDRRPPKHVLSENDLAFAKLDSMLNVAREDQLRESDDDAPSGLDPTRAQDYVAPPTEDEAYDSLVEANAWLSSLAELLPADEDEAKFLGLSDGLEYTQRKVTQPWGDEYLPIHSPDEAVEYQIERNEESFAKRAARRIEARRDSFAALAKLCAA